MKAFCCLLCLFFPLLIKAQIITTIAGSGTNGFSGDGGAATAASLQLPAGIAIDSLGNIYISDSQNERVRKIDVGGTINTIAGTGPTGPGTGGYGGDGGAATSALLNNPAGVATDGHGNIYICDWSNSRIRKVDTAGIITTIAGLAISGFSGDGGPATAAKIDDPVGIAIDGIGNIYFADRSNHRIRKIDTSGIITTVAGNGTAGYSGDGGPATDAQFNYAATLTVDDLGNIYLTDVLSRRIRKIDISGTIVTIAGNGTSGFSGDGGPATSAVINTPFGITIDKCGNLYFGDGNFRVRKIDNTGIITTYAGDGTTGYGGDGGLAALAQLGRVGHMTADKFGNLYFTITNYQRVRKITTTNHQPSLTLGAAHSFSVCESSGAHPIDSALAMSDADTGQTITWSIVTPPSHGILTAAYTATATGGVLISTGSSYTPATSYIGNDTFKIQITDCGSLSDTITFYVNVVNCTIALANITIDNISEGQYSIYPNPTQGELIITSTIKITSVSIYNPVGQTLYHHNYDSGEVLVNVTDMPSGIYYVKINELEVKKFVKQ